MTRFSNILLLVDPAADMDTAPAQAARLARGGGGRLTLISVVPEPSALERLLAAEEESLSTAREVAARQGLLAGLAERLRGEGVEVEGVAVTQGIVFVEVVRDVLRHTRDLVVTAAQAHEGLRERLFGTVATHLMRNCPCPVLAAKPQGPKRLTRVLAAVDVADDLPDPSRESLNPRILETAASLAAAEGAELHLVQAWTVPNEGYAEARGNLDPTAVERMRTRAERIYAERVDWLVREASGRGLTPVRHLTRGDPTQVIRRLVADLRPDLLVMGTVSRTGVAGLLIGNTAERVLSEVDCSVLTLKPEGFVTPVTLPDDDPAAS